MKSVSIVVPVYNEEKFIQDTLKDLLSQNYTGKMEIIIADGFSTDKTRDIIHDFQKKHSNIQLVDNPGKDQANGLNCAIKSASYPWIIRVDGHSRYRNDYVTRSIECLESTKADIAGGPMRPIYKGIFDEAVGIATCSKLGIGNSQFHFQEKRGFVEAVYLGAFSKKLWEELGGFDPEVVPNEDDDFSVRVRNRKGKIYLEPEIFSEYFPRTSPLSLFKQYYRYGFYRWKVILKHRQLVSIRHLIPFFFVLMNFLFLIPLGKRIREKCFQIMVVYFNLGFISMIHKTRRIPIVFCGLLVYWILHFSYGLGFAVSLLSSLVRRGNK